MASQKIKAAIKGSIASPEAAEKVIASLDAAADVAELELEVATKLTASQAAAVADIADPSSATAEDAANSVNALLASLRAAGLLAAE